MPTPHSDQVNIQRHLDKIELALQSASAYFEHDSQAKAALHVTGRVLYSPVYVITQEALTSLNEIKETLKNDE